MKFSKEEYNQFLTDIRGNPKIQSLYDIPGHIQEYSKKVNKDDIHAIKVNRTMKNFELPKFSYHYQKLLIMIPDGLSEQMRIRKAILGALVYFTCSKESIENEYFVYSSEQQFLSENKDFGQNFRSVLEAYHHKITH